MSDYTLIIPVLNIETNPYLEELLSNLSKQALLPREVHLVVGDRRQGRAINYGVKQAGTKYIGTVDDDTLIDDPELFEKIINAMEADTSIGMGGAACAIPDFASRFQKRAMQQIPRRFFPVQKENIDSDMVQHPCLIMPRKLFIDIKGEDEDLVRGLDPVLRKKVRDAGKRVTIIANTWVYHLIPDNFWKITKMYYRNGRGSGFATRYYPERVIELTDGYDKGEFVEKRSLWYRIFRRFGSLFMSIFCCKFIKVMTDLGYIAGVVKEKIHPSYSLDAPKIVSIEKSEKEKYPFKLFIHQVELAE